MSAEPEILKFKRKPEKHKLTKRTVESLRPPAEINGKPAQDWTYDTQVPKLAICVWTSGRKVWYWAGRFNRQAVKVKLGGFPEMTSEQARKRAAQLSADAEQGIDPRDKRRKSRTEITLQELFDLYLEQHAKPHKRTWKDDEETFTRYCGDSRLRNRGLSDITRSDIRELHTSVGKRGKYSANRLLALLSKVFAFGMDSDDVAFSGPSPTKGIKRFPEEQRDRFLQPDEMQRFFKALDQEKPIIRDFFLLCLYTGARRGNVQSMRWEELEVDRAEWKIPGEKFKNGKSHTIHLPAEAISILQRRYGEAESEYVFSAPKSECGYLTSTSRVWKRITDRAELKGLRVHDLRRTLGSYQAATGASLPMIGRTLGHLDQSTTAIYARLNLDPVRTSVDTAVAAMLAAARQDTPTD